MSKLTLVKGSAVPSAVDAGALLRKVTSAGDNDGLTNADLAGNLVLFYNATVTAAEVATAVLRLWGFNPDDSKWYPVGPALQGGNDVDRGKLNNAVALGELSASDDRIAFTQLVSGLGAFSRVYLQEVSTGGAGFASTASLRSVQQV